MNGFGLGDDKGSYGLSASMQRPGAFIPSYQAGGVVSPMGPAPAGLAPQSQPAGGSGMSPEMLRMHVNQFASQHPQELAKIRQVIQQLVASGELTPQELNMIVQLATVAAQNPEMYPYVRNFAIQQGIATEQDLPQQYDQGLVMALLIAARAAQEEGGETGEPTMPAGAATAPSMATGGTVPQSRKQDGSVLINAHEGEYVIPRHVVAMKGREFFDSLLAKYQENPQQK